MLAGVIVSTRDSRRRTDGSGEAASWSARRDIAIAEEAYRLFVERGRDRSRADECWQIARAKVSDTLRPRAIHENRENTKRTKKSF